MNTKYVTDIMADLIAKELEPQLLKLQIHLVYQDGTVEIIYHN